MTATANSEELHRRLRTNVVWHDDIMCLDYRGVMIVDRSEVAKLSKLLRPHIAKRVVINLRNVVSLPPGYFGQLCDGVERGIAIRLVDATPEVQAMQWYQKFVNEQEEFRICPT